MILAHQVRDVRAAEEAALASVPPGTLMQRAAAALAVECAAVLRRRYGKVTGRRVVLLVGAGNNGGDALWAGVRLAGRGARVAAVLTSSSVHAEGLNALRTAGGTVLDARPDDGRAPAARELLQADLVVVGLVGLGGSPGLRSPADMLVAGIPEGIPVVAVDLPSGVDPDTGATPAEHVWADVTVTFGTAKPCLLLPPASAAAGRVRVVDIGLGPRLPLGAAVERLDTAALAERWPVPRGTDDKYRRGVLGVLAGSGRYPGAAVLTCAGALRAGAGMVRYLGPESVADAVRAAWPEVVGGPGRVQAWVLGPGLDDEEPAEGFIEAALTAALDSPQPCVVDAGALSAWARRWRAATEDAGSGLAAAEPGLAARDADRVLLTPHAGELARLLTDLDRADLDRAVPDRAVPDRAVPVSRADVEARPYEHAARAARLAGATVLLKGATTLVVRPDGRARSQADAPAWLATAGAGDVLAGVAGALLAAGLGAFDAGAVAAAVHGRAAALASAGGPVVAGDVASAIPRVVAELAAARGTMAE